MQGEFYVNLQQIDQQQQFPPNVLIGVQDVLASGNSAGFLKAALEDLETTKESRGC